MSEEYTLSLIIPGRREQDNSIMIKYEKGGPFFDQLLTGLEKEGHSFSLCGGKGVCGKCRIRYINHAPNPTSGERKFLSPQELREGIRLSCFSQPVKSCTIEILFTQQITIMEEFTLHDLPTSSCDSENENKRIIAVDIGTTTVAMALREMNTGRIVDTYAVVNPQRKYGADVIARTLAACGGAAQDLKECITKVIQDGIDHFGNGDYSIYVAANTVMNHLFTGSDVSKLGVFPFEPEYLDRKEFRIDAHKGVVLPGISAFVGGDITAGMIGCGILPITKETRGKLLIDLGTNGEMAISDGERIYVTATAAGPAFEGGSEDVKIGSNMVHFLSEMLKKGIMDDTGLLEEPYFTNGYMEADARITQKDIRNLQLAKAAVRVGIEVLIKKANLDKTEISQVYLAGGFGYRMDVEEAIVIGLIPTEFRTKTIAVGNAALEGAFCYGVQEYSANSSEKVHFMNSISNLCISINLAEEPGFLEQYVDKLNFQYPSAYIE